MSADVSAMRARLEPLPVRLRIAHLAALIRREAKGSLRAGELKHLLAAQSAEFPASMIGGRAG
jgi:hypothetical protein